jgi:hypothetical protein
MTHHAPWLVALAFFVLFCIEHWRNARLTADCMNRLSARSLQEYAALKPVLEQERAEPRPRAQKRTEPQPRVEYVEPEVDAVEARAAFESLMGE